MRTLWNKLKSSVGITAIEALVIVFIVVVILAILTPAVIR